MSREELLKELFNSVEIDDSVEGKMAGLVEDLLQIEFGSLSDEGKVTLRELHSLINEMWKNKGVK
jgi:hypothetical protein